jgi:serine/threonine-protein kinase
LAPSERAQRRFATEGEAIGRIHHPNVISLLGHGSLDDGRPFLVMEYHPGETLKSYLKGRPPLGPYSAVKLGQQLLDGIAAAHDEGIIHRDIKPANILLARLGSGKRQIKILDFGVARVIDITLDPDMRLTQMGAVLGSPQYMPPEVARGMRDVDVRADIFGLGAVLYHSLMGRPPFMGATVGEIMRRIAAHEFPSLADERPDAPPALITAIDRAMAHSPEDRFPSARAMREALDKVPVEPPEQ